ncbi:MAG TPA: BlaI/MecI/CopY family transcriptional regulator [Fimbriimonadaceae bacterium]|nr:BlaI/MecI/CopY family transcriptional regulator [Fimbriimonadaceae bacterium]HRJ32979.1 BlaI/MecI/CopY family transcriptional regulator [Fimbriimonadaceae bacterium]
MSKHDSPSDPPTGAQWALLEILAEGPEAGLTAAEVWAQANRVRPMARTTVITLLGRLVERGWIARMGNGRGALYRPLHESDHAAAHLADGFLNRFFGGSPSRMVLNLLGSGRVSAEEIHRLRKLLNESQAEENQK